jgi:ribonucleoside-diphosphate reductase alpha chain
MTGPQTPFAEQLHAEKYRTKGESFREAMNRIASALTDNTEDFKSFRDILLDQRFLPAGRVQAAVGSTRRTTAYNCFVSATMEDSFVEGDNSIMDCAKQAATTMRMGGGIGYDFSTLRPKGDLIKKLQSRSGGPLSFMPIFDGVGKATQSAGHRRGAQMGVLRVDHPDIVDFIHAKNNTDNLTGFNISVAITDEFMTCLESGHPFPLQFQGRDYGEVDAAALWEMIMRSTWDWAEPGVLFIDTINRMNNLGYCEYLAATNPCGEQPLPPFGACLLGSFNLTKYISLDQGRVAMFDWQQLAKDVRAVVRAMDRVCDVSHYPLEQQRLEALSKRRMGLGVTGLANAVEAYGFSYGSARFIRMEENILEVIRDYSYQASVELARERGAFPLFDAEKYCDGGFIKTLPPDLQDDIRRYGIRNSHLTSIAPTGTISMTADNVSSGIEPVFSLRGTRTVNMSDGTHEVEFNDYGLRVFGVEGKVCDDVSIQEHVDVLIAASDRVDSAVSKTCNVPPDTEWQAFKDIYRQAWERGAKGCTTFNVGGKRMGILKAAPKEEEEGGACTYDPATGARSCEG